MNAKCAGMWLGTLATLAFAAGLSAAQDQPPPKGLGETQRAELLLQIELAERRVTAYQEEVKVAEIETKLEMAKRDTVRARVTKSQSEEASAGLAYTRADKLAKQAVISKQEVEEAHLKWEQAKQAVAIASHELVEQGLRVELAQAKLKRGQAHEAEVTTVLKQLKAKLGQ